jgi:hypothetical protein
MLFCKEKPAEHTSAQPATTTDQVGNREVHQGVQVPVPFVPPADSAISVDRMKSWSSCNPLLDSLTFRYADSFKTEDPATLMRYQEDFINAQDKICIRAGLPGGFQEYKWILQNMGLEKNRPMLESVNAQSF